VLLGPTPTPCFGPEGNRIVGRLGGRGAIGGSVARCLSGGVLVRVALLGGVLVRGDYRRVFVSRGRGTIGGSIARCLSKGVLGVFVCCASRLPFAAALDAS